MTIKRFQDFPKRNEDVILDECGWPNALPSNLSMEYTSFQTRIQMKVGPVEL